MSESRAREPGHLSEDQIVALEEPQDAIFRLTQGTIAHIDHEAA